MEQSLIIDQSTATIGPVEQNEFGDRFFCNLNHLTFHKVSAKTVFEAEFTSALFRANNLYVVIGTDSGLLPRHIIETGIPEGTRYIFIEPEVILTQLQAEGVLESHEHCIYAHEESWLEAMDTFKMTEYFFINGVSTLNALCAQINALDAYAELSWYVAEMLTQLQYKVVVPTSTEPFMIQQLLNLADNRHHANLLLDSFKGKTAFILGGGPSLDDALPWLIKHRKSVVILGVSRVVKRLLQVGLEPDIVFSVDPFAGNFDVSKDIFSLSDKPLFIYSYHIYHELLSQWPGRALYLGARLPWSSPLNEANMSGTGPTVTNTALTVGYQLGFKRIFLAGVDLCYTLDGFTHAKGSNEHAAGARFNLTGVEVETYSGVMAPTGLDYSLARDILALQAERIVGSKYCQLFNTAEMAAKVPLIDYMPLSDIIPDKQTVDAQAVFNALLIPKNEDVFFTKVSAELDRVTFQLNTIKHVAQEALDCNEGMYNASGLIDNYKEKRRLDKLEQLLRRKYRHFGHLVRCFGIRNFLKMTKPFDDDSWTSDEVKWRLRVYYQSYLDGSTRLINLIKDTKKRVIARAEEHKAEPDWSLIIEQARADKCYGRVHFWRTLPSAKDIPKKIQQIFSEFEETFSKELQRERANHAESMKKNTDLSLLKHRSQMLFKYKKMDLLQHLLFALDKHHDPEGAIPYRCLIQGYIAELEHDPIRALDCYQEALAYPDGPMQEALLRITYLDFEVGTGDTAHRALECLALMNVRYLLFYGESCRLRGDTQSAVDAYMSYLTLFPEDVIVQLKLARIYMDQKIYDGAMIMIDLILKKHPKQETALLMKKKLQAM